MNPAGADVAFEVSAPSSSNNTRGTALPSITVPTAISATLQQYATLQHISNTVPTAISATTAVPPGYMHQHMEGGGRPEYAPQQPQPLFRQWQPTGGVEVKGKGIMMTYLWNEEEAERAEREEAEAAAMAAILEASATRNEMCEGGSDDVQDVNQQQEQLCAGEGSPPHQPTTSVTDELSELGCQFPHQQKSTHLPIIPNGHRYVKSIAQVLLGLLRESGYLILSRSSQCRSFTVQILNASDIRLSFINPYMLLLSFLETFCAFHPDALFLFFLPIVRLSSSST